MCLFDLCQIVTIETMVKKKIIRTWILTDIVNDLNEYKSLIVERKQAWGPTSLGNGLGMTIVHHGRNGRKQCRVRCLHFYVYHVTEKPTGRLVNDKSRHLSRFTCSLMSYQSIWAARHAVITMLDQKETVCASNTPFWIPCRWSASNSLNG